VSTQRAEIPDLRLVFLERCAARLQLVNSADMTLDEAIAGLREALEQMRQTMDDAA
jgi:hypothetical protein